MPLLCRLLGHRLDVDSDHYYGYYVCTRCGVEETDARPLRWQGAWYWAMRCRWGEIIDRGRGPELRGTRITVYRIMDYLRYGIPSSEIASELGLTRGQVHTAITYIQSHRDEVEAEYDAILSDVNQPNAPVVEQGRAKSREELRQRIMERHARKGAHDRPIGQDVRGAVALLQSIVQSEFADVAAELDLRFLVLEDEEIGLTRTATMPDDRYYIDARALDCRAGCLAVRDRLLIAADSPAGLHEGADGVLAYYAWEDPAGEWKATEAAEDLCRRLNEGEAVRRLRDEARSVLIRALDSGVDDAYCDLHNLGTGLLGNTQASDLDWLARVLFEASRLGGGDVRTVPWLIGPEQWEALGLVPQASWGDGPRRWDMLDGAQQEAWRKLARIVLYVLPRFAERVGHRFMAQAKAIGRAWNEARKEGRDDGR